MITPILNIPRLRKKEYLTIHNNEIIKIVPQNLTIVYHDDKFIVEILCAIGEGTHLFIVSEDFKLYDDLKSFESNSFVEASDFYFPNMEIKRTAIANIDGSNKITYNTWVIQNDIPSKIELNSFALHYNYCKYGPSYTNYTSNFSGSYFYENRESALAYCDIKSNSANGLPFKGLLVDTKLNSDQKKLINSFVKLYSELKDNNIKLIYDEYNGKFIAFNNNGDYVVEYDPAIENCIEFSKNMKRYALPIEVFVAGEECCIYKKSDETNRS